MARGGKHDKYIDEIRLLVPEIGYSATARKLGLHADSLRVWCKRRGIKSPHKSTDRKSQEEAGLMPIKDIARILGVHPATVKRDLDRALNKLSLLLEDYIEL